MTDAELLHEARRGDAEAWRTLYRRCLPTVWRLAYALVNDVHAAEDVTSETMLAFIQNLDRLEPEAPNFIGWLRSVVHCKAADHFRKAFRLRDKLATVAESLTAVATQTVPQSNLELNETRQRVLDILDAMPERQRLVLEWKYLDAFRVREIAERLGDTEKAVETALYRARREFRRIYESDAFCGAKVRGHRPSDVAVSQESSWQDEL